ncbi:MAG: MtnX-like HAD-IB family phosphatase [Halanaerobiales bacterium]|nr:MtnX-like HAD-IB family phosphatase [Halanaerobiales bacterium]
MNTIDKNAIILCDFDGTITKKDVNDTVFNVFGNDKNKKIEKQYINNQISGKEALKKHYLNLDISEKEFLDYILNNIKIDSYFPRFLRLIKNKELNFVVVSGGFLNYIIPLFNKYNININFEIYANKLIFKDNKIKVDFLHDIKSCHQEFGVCGNCKYKIAKKYKRMFEQIIYIGDGMTDRCVVELADFLYVKNNSRLENYCNKKDIKHITFTSFLDLYHMFEEEKRDALSWN